MNLKEVCHYNTNNPRNEQLRTTYNLEKDQCLAHVHEARILRCGVHTEIDLLRCPDFERDEESKFEKKPTT